MYEIRLIKKIVKMLIYITVEFSESFNSLIILFLLIINEKNKSKDKEIEK
jgi:hypothetical protein